MGKLAVQVFDSLVLDKVIAEYKIFEVPEEIPDKEFDIIFSASYPTRVTDEVCTRAKMAALNIHTGLLPQQRGSNPLNWALIWGDKTTGVTIHKMVRPMDAGDIVLQSPVQIENKDNILTLTEKCKESFVRLIKMFFETPETYLRHSAKQNQAMSSYAQKRYPEDSELNLNVSAKELYNLFRSCDPADYPAYVVKDGKKVIVKRVTQEGKITYDD